jgi:hypothetical protein
LTVYRSHGQDAFIANAIIVESFKQAAVNFLRAGEKLYEVIVLRHYKTLGYSSFRAYCASVGISRSFGYQLADIHEWYVLRAECPPAVLSEIPQSNLAVMVPCLKDGSIDIADEEQLAGWMYAMSTLPRSDLITEKRMNFGDELTDAAVPWRRKAALWKAIAKKYYRKDRRKWLS